MEAYLDKYIKHHNYFEGNPEVFTKEIHEMESGMNSAQGIMPSYRDWKIPFSYVLQQFIRLAVELAQLKTKEQLIDLYINSKDDYNTIIYVLIEKYRDYTSSILKDITLSVYIDSVNTLSNGKIILIIIICCSMVITIGAYIALIYRVLSVIRYKSEVMSVFADIPEKTIRSMIENISKTSIGSMRYNPKEVCEKEVDLVMKRATLKAFSATEEISNQTTSVKLNDNKTVNEEGIPETKVKVDNELSENELKKKREILMLSDQASKRRGIFILTAFVLAVLAYYAGSIGIVFIIFNNYDSLSYNVRWVSLRNAIMTMGHLLLRELVIIDKVELRMKADDALSELYRYEQNIQNLKANAMNLYNNYKRVTTRLDSEEFCEVIKDELTIELYEECKSERDYSMQRGMQNNIYQIISYFNSIQNRYIQFGGQMNPEEILSISGWPISSILFINN